jgi:hypothetical protein
MILGSAGYPKRKPTVAFRPTARLTSAWLGLAESPAHRPTHGVAAREQPFKGDKPPQGADSAMVFHKG